MNFPIRLVDTICNSANPCVWVFKWKLLSSSWAELSGHTAGLPCNAVQGGFNFWVRGWNPKVWLFKWKLLSRTFQSYCWFTTQYKVVLTFEFVDKIQKMSVTVQMKATEQSFPVVPFIMLYKVVLTFESVDEILKCDCSNESYRAELSCGTVYYVVQGGSNFRVCEWNPKVFLIQMKALEQFLPVKLFTLLYKKS